MNTEKIEKLKKGLTNSQIPESLREKIREQIKKMEAEDLKESAPKVVNVAPEEKEEPTPAPKVEKAKVTRTPRVKKVVEHKESTTKKPTAMALAKEIRKDGESWKEAVKRASSEMKKGTTETKKAVVETKKATITEMQKLLKFVKRRKELKNISGTNLQRDASRSAKPSGKRTSKEGNVYYENRENRTDRLAPNYPKGAPKLEMGGGIKHYVVNDKIFIDYMEAVDYCDRNNLSYSEIKKTNKFLDGGFMDGVYAENGAELGNWEKYQIQDKNGYVSYFDNKNYAEKFLKENEGSTIVRWDDEEETTYTRNKDGIRVKSVAMPEERLTEAEWLAKHNESREARTYQLGGGIFADTFTGYTGTHYTGLVGETNAMSSGEMFMAGGRVRRTKSQMTKDRENKEIDAYNWYVVDLEENKAITGNEYREDAIDALSDYDGDKRYKVVSKKTLKSLGIENPNESWKSYALGGAIKNQYAGRTPENIWNSLSIQQRQHFLIDHFIENEYDVQVKYKDLNEDDEEFVNEYSNKEWKKLSGDVKQAFREHVKIGEYAKGGGVREVGNREYSYGRNWTNDHRHENKHEDYEVPMYKRK